MDLPILKDELIAVAKTAIEKSPEHYSSGRQRFILQVNLLDIDLIKEYASQYLSQKEHLGVKHEKFLPHGFNTSMRHRTQRSIEEFLDSNPNYVDTFNAIGFIIKDYMEDMARVLDYLGKGGAYNAANNMAAEAGTETLSTELLPQILHGLSRTRFKPTAKSFSHGLNHAFGRNAFGDRIPDAYGKTDGCPFGRRIASIFALQPQRISDDEVIILPHKKAGALPAFICDEITTSRLQNRPASAPHLST